MSTTRTAPDQRRRSSISPALSEGSSFASSPSMRPPTTPNTTMTPSPEPAVADNSSLGTFLAEVDEWLLHINQRVAELESRHRKHLSMDSGWLAGVQFKDLGRPGGKVDMGTGTGRNQRAMKNPGYASASRR